MKTFAQLIVLTSLISVTLGAPATLEQRAPAAYVRVFSVPECVAATGNGDVSKSYVLPLNQCVRPTNPFASFRAGVNGKCPSGKKAAVIGYSSTDCTGAGQAAQDFPADGSEGACVNTVIDASKGTPGGQSAKFVCQ